MHLSEADFHQRLLATFYGEAAEHLHTMTAGLIALEQASTAEGQREAVESIFREAHSLKGAAHAVNLHEWERLCQGMESVFAAWQRQEARLSLELFDCLHQAIDRLALLLRAGEGQAAHGEPSLAALAYQLSRALTVAQGTPSDLPTSPVGSLPEATPAALPIQPSASPSATLRLSAERLDRLLLQSEELIGAKLTMRDHARTLAALRREFAMARREQMHAAPGTAQSLAEIDYKLTTLTHLVEQSSRTFGAMVDNLQADLKQVLMLPFAALVEAFPKLVRDLSREQGKEVILIVQGGELELSRRIWEAMKDPLMHLLRNCIDHGLEAPAERARQGKPRQGTIRLTLTPLEGNWVELAIADDGIGINPSSVKAVAVKQGIISATTAETLNEDEAQALIFQSGLSTSTLITAVSGRGLGLAIVHEKVQAVGGTITLQTQPNRGTTFHIRLPLTLANTRGILIRVGDQHLLILTLHVERVIRIAPTAIQTVAHRPCLWLAGEPVPLIRLAELLAIPTPVANAGHWNAVVLGTAGQRVAFIVDEICSEQEVLARDLGPMLTRVRNVEGASILGSGQVVPILNTADLIQSAQVHPATAIPLSATPPVVAARRRILVAEDSITARTLLKGILDAAGYFVQTTVDGVEALGHLKVGNFDLVVSDVEMPRMNGFALTSEIRRDRRLVKLPVILVTALESREDRARGIEVGANAYLVKSNFAQSNLLEVIQRLIGG
ncbi:MAG: response regulator [Caldilineaceae bacterium]|nr:response regulator [Caldilineaceae bacterium]